MTLLLTFETISAALDCEGILSETGRPCRVIPVPRSLGSSCVYAIRLETRPPSVEADGKAEGKTDGNAASKADAADEVGALCRDLRARGAGFARVFRCIETGGRETYEELRTCL
ncbi:MAG: DUF3343 domain-containing protein [Treponema sp.]|jgi:hypothetical protein|nr:DUF3343 domain-containing protein [Treponema sp.]